MSESIDSGPKFRKFWTGFRDGDMLLKDKAGEEPDVEEPDVVELNGEVDDEGDDDEESDRDVDRAHSSSRGAGRGLPR